MKFLLVFIFIFGCATRPKKEDLKKAWIGQDLSRLEKHEYFASLPTQKKELSTNETLINVQENRYRATGGQTCFGTGFGRGFYNRVGIGASTCSPQEYSQDNCTHQFTLKNNTITNYTIVGDYCDLDCKYLPKMKCSSKK